MGFLYHLGCRQMKVGGRKLSSQYLFEIFGLKNDP